jgi:heme A synthase
MNVGRTLALTATATLFLTISMGGYTTQTGSGLACPDWPLCHGKLFPQPLTASLLIEWTHRLFAATSALFVILTAAYLYVRRRSHKGLVVRGLITLLLLLFQIALGGVVVLQELESLLVTLHLSIAVATFGMMVSVATDISRKER